MPATRTIVTFEGLVPGHYAAAIIHDENANRKLDTALGIPRKGSGFTRYPAIGFGPPRFDAARLAANGAATLSKQVACIHSPCTALRS